MTGAKTESTVNVGTTARAYSPLSVRRRRSERFAPSIGFRLSRSELIGFNRGRAVAALKRGARLVVPDGSTTLEAGDVLTLVGGEAALQAARERLDGAE